jgi:hypothetical protein
MAFVKADVSEGLITSNFRVERISEVGETLSITRNALQLLEDIRSSKSSVLTRAILRNVPEDGILMVTAVKTSNLTLSSQFPHKFSVI